MIGFIVGVVVGVAATIAVYKFVLPHFTIQ